MSSNNTTDETRLIRWGPTSYEYDERYDYDSLLTDENAAILTDENATEIDPEFIERLPVSRSYCDDPSSEIITCANCQQFESMNYSYTHDSNTTYCGDCALQLFNKVVYKPARMSITTDIVINLYECHRCGIKTYQQFNAIPCCHKCAHFETLLHNYTAEEQHELVLYANEYNLTIEESIEYQTQCHACSKELPSIFAQIDHENHRYCSKWCFESSEEYYIPCFRKDGCLVCNTWYIHEFRENPDRYRVIPVLSAIDALKELYIYNQLDDSLIDLVEYFV